jgi:2-keto-4-pentenoate hydratase
MPSSREETAARLRRAYLEGAIPPLREVLESTDAAGAYVVQDINTQIWQAAGRRIVGRKIGLTAKAVQAQMGVSTPDYGVLFHDMEISDGGVLYVSQTIQPKAEGEVALVLAHDIKSADPSPEEIGAATEYAVAAIEIVDSRIESWKISYADTVADNGSSAFYVLGRERKSLFDLDLFSCGMVLEINDEIKSVGAGGACLGHPLKAAAWLAKTLASLGLALNAGDIVLTGALGPMVAISPGDHVKAVIGGLGKVSFSYSN